MQGGEGDDPWEEMGTCVMGQGIDGATWSCPYPSGIQSRMCATGWTSCGRFCASVMETGTFSAAEGALYPADDGPSLVARVFDTQQHSWMPELPLAGLELGGSQEVSFADPDAPHVAAVLGCNEDRDDALIIFETRQHRFHVLTGLLSSLWLPHTHVLILWEWDRLARLDLQPWPAEASTDSLTWVPFPEASELNSRASLAASPDGRQLWAARAVSKLEDGIRVALWVYAAADLSSAGPWRLDIAGGEEYLALCATHCAVAISFAGRSICVWRLDGPRLLGQLLWRSKPLRGLSFSLDGRWVAGFTRRATLRVLDMRTGESVARVQRPALCVPKHAGVRVTWGCPVASKLLVQYDTVESVLFRVLKF